MQFVIFYPYINDLGSSGVQFVSASSDARAQRTLSQRLAYICSVSGFLLGFRDINGACLSLADNCWRCVWENGIISLAQIGWDVLA